MLPSILAFAAPSGTGKTTLVEGVVRALVARGLRVAVLKSDAHRLVLDTPGKDSWRFGEAGATPVVVLGAERLALFERLDGAVSLGHAVAKFAPDVDLVLAEGFRRSGVPTIRVHRAGIADDPRWDPPQNVVAWASDGAPAGAGPVVLPLGDPDAVAAWILANYLPPAPRRRPTLVVPVATVDGVDAAVVAVRRLSAALDAPGLLVAAPGVRVVDVPMVHDLRPQLGLLGAILTGLAAADTPEILVVGARHHAATAAFVRGLVEAGPARADLVYPIVDGFPEPALAIYGHRCLSSIQAALLTGERKLTSWWGQVRSFGVSPEVWRGWDPAGVSFR